MAPQDKNVLQCINVYDECEKNLRSYYSQKYTIEDVKNVWERLSEWIVTCLKNSKSVIIKQLGTFTLSKWSLETGIRKELKISKPTFIISKSIQEDFFTYQIKNYEDKSVPVALINYCDIAKKCGCTKETVLSCLDDIVKTLRKLLHQNRDVLLQMPNLGVLTVQKGEAEFVFTNECLTNKKVPNEFCHRYKKSCEPFHPKRKVPCEFHMEIK